MIKLLMLMLLTSFGCSPSSGSSARMAEADLLNSVFLAPPLQPGGAFLLCFRFEVTQGEFHPQLASHDDANFPANSMTRPEAEAWARQQGMRLPQRAEWFHLLYAGSPTLIVKGDRANTLELGLRQALKVGVFERGKTALGGYDFVGNVWEWLGDEPDALALGVDQEHALQIGVSFASYLPDRPDQEFEWHREAHEENRASDVGFRPVADALPWLHNFILPVWPAASTADQAALELALHRWRPYLRRQLAKRWLDEYPGEAEFGSFLAGD